MENSLASFARSGGFAGTHKYIQDIPIKTICEDDRILGKKELKNKNNSRIKFCRFAKLWSSSSCGFTIFVGKIIQIIFCKNFIILTKILKIIKM